MNDVINIAVSNGDNIEAIISDQDIINIGISNADTVQINFYDTLNVSAAMEMTVNITVGSNIIPHTLGRKVTMLTAFYEGRLLGLDWTNIDPATSEESITNIYVPDAALNYSNVTLYIL